METNNITYIINEKEFTFSYSGEMEKGKAETLLSRDENLLKNTPWDELGYTIQDFLSEDDNKELRNVVTHVMRGLIEACGGKTDSEFTLEKYHTYVNDDIHLSISKSIKDGWKNEDFPFDLAKINKRLSEILNQPVSTVAEDKNINDFYLRIVRPSCLQDNNPPHRDVWLDRLRNAINIYFPICGSTLDSALPLLPGSHKYKESDLVRTSEGAVLNNTKYTVPCVISINGEPLKMVRPNPSENEVMVFSPYLVHGGGYNTNEDTTRISLEMRFWKVNK
jgi:hypothetical protein